MKGLANHCSSQAADFQGPSHFAGRPRYLCMHKKSNAMFGNLFGDFEKKQEELRERLDAILVDAEVEDGAVRVTATAAGELRDLVINPEKLDVQDVEALQDLVLEAVNRALDEARKVQAETSRALIKDMLPPGFDKLFG